MRIQYITILTLILTFISTSLIGQDNDYTVVVALKTDPLECNVRTARAFNRSFKKSFSDRVLFMDKAGINTMSIKSKILSVDLKDEKDSTYLAKLETEIHLTSNINGLDNKISVQSEAMGKSICDAQRNAFMKAIKGENKSKIDDLLKRFYMENFESYCSSISEKASSLMQDKQYQYALALLNTIPDESSCSKGLNTLRTKIIAEIASLNCQQEMEALSLIVNSGEINQIKRNTYRLLRIPPSATCLAEAKTLSKRIEKMMKSNNLNSRDLKIFSEYMTEQDEISWRNQYLRSSKL